MLKGRVQSSPRVVNGVLYIGSDDSASTFGGHMVAIAAESGKQIWDYKTEREVTGAALVDVGRGRVYFGDRSCHGPRRPWVQPLDPHTPLRQVSRMATFTLWI